VSISAYPRLPGGAALAPGEKVLVTDRFMLNSVAVYLHTEIALSDRRLSAARPNTLLGLIPVGTSRSNFPIESIAGVTAATLFSVPAFLVGLMAGLAGFLGLSSPGNTGGGVLLLVLGLLLIISAPRQAIAVMNSGGGVIRFPVAVFERGRTVEFANRVSEALARTPRPFRGPDSGGQCHGPKCPRCTGESQ
jgi:hypothetical protein